jgi:hypothetical protein
MNGEEKKREDEHGDSNSVQATIEIFTDVGPPLSIPISATLRSSSLVT